MRLGQEVRDRVTGFTGIVTAKVEYLNGCVQYHVRPKVREDQKFPEGAYIDQEYLEVIGTGLAPGQGEPRAARDISSGGEMQDAPKGMEP